MRNSIKKQERGFVLVTSLIMLSLLTLLSLGMFFTSRTATQTSGAAQASTEAYYYAETAINYISWSMAQDTDGDGFPEGAELDNFNYTGTYIHGGFGGASSLGDFRELGSYYWDPGPIVDNSDSGNGIVGQVMYFDNSPMNARTICFEDASVFSNCIDVTVDPATRVAPSMFQISVNLPRYIKLDISTAGVITPSIPQLPHQDPPVVGQDIPQNGAVVWITAGDPNNTERDIEIFPLDPARAKEHGVLPSVCTGGQMTDYSASSCPCDYATIDLANDVACATHANGDATAAAAMGDWLTSYRIVAYAIGYVNGRASHLIRAVIR